MNSPARTTNPAGPPAEAPCPALEQCRSGKALGCTLSASSECGLLVKVTVMELSAIERVLHSASYTRIHDTEARLQFLLQHLYARLDSTELSLSPDRLAVLIRSRQQNSGPFIVHL